MQQNRTESTDGHKNVVKKFWWDSADLNRSPSVPNARGWTRLPYYPAEYFLSKGIILYIAFVRNRVCYLCFLFSLVQRCTFFSLAFSIFFSFFLTSLPYLSLFPVFLTCLSFSSFLFSPRFLFLSFSPIFFSCLPFLFSLIPSGYRCRFLS